MKYPKFYFKVYSVDEYGDIENSKCFRSYDKAVQFQNDLTREQLKIIGDSIIDRNEWGEYIETVKENLEEYEKITGRTYPIIAIEEEDDRKINYSPCYVEGYEENGVELRQVILELVSE